MGEDLGRQAGAGPQMHLSSRLWHLELFLVCGQHLPIAFRWHFKRINLSLLCGRNHSGGETRARENI